MNWKKCSELGDKYLGGVIVYFYDANRILECSYDGFFLVKDNIRIKPSPNDLFVKRWDFFKESGLYDKLGDLEKEA